MRPSPSSSRVLRRGPVPVGTILGAVPGALLGLASGAVAVVRRNKPLHPRGVVGDARLEITDPLSELGVPLFASRGTHVGIARWSRGAGFPAPLPDVEGFALRLLDPLSDLHFSSAGSGALTRHLLVPRLAGRHGLLSTLVPVASPAGRLMLAVRPVSEGRPPGQWQLEVALDGGPWRPVGVIDVGWGSDHPVRFDPFLNVLPGTQNYPAVVAVCEPAYVLARRGASPRPVTTGS